MRARGHSGFPVALALLTLGWALSSQPGRAQPVVGGQGLKFTKYYEAPHETQMKWMLESASAQRQLDGRYLGNDVKYQTFRVTGGGEMTVQAPQCLYDENQGSISSAGPLRVQTADGKFAIEGEGFLYRQTNSILYVSNRVHTIISPELLGPQTATFHTNTSAEAAPGMDIFSDRFTYAVNAGQGIYDGNVRVTGTNLASTAEQMTVLISVTNRQLQSLTATQNVTVDYVTPEHERIQATGGQASYWADTDVVRMSGEPTWRVGQREGSGDELVFDRTNNIFRAIGHASLKMPARSMGSSGLFSRTNAGAASPSPPTNQFVEVTCDNYELRTNLAFFREQVRVSERVGDQPKGQMTCGQLALAFAGTNELQSMIAEHQVVIGQEDKEFRAERAEYTGTNSLLELTGDPHWQAGPREGKGDKIRVNLARDEMLVRGNAFMRLPAGELGQSAIGSLGPPKPGASKGATNEFAEVFSEEYFLSPNSGLFHHHVRIEHPQMNWTSEEVTMLMLPELGKTGRMIIGEPEVVFDVKDDQGRNFHGTGDKVVYTHRATATLTNDFVELTGRPAVLEATNVVGRNNLITLDLASHTLTAPGKYRLWGTAPAAATTTLQPLKTKPKRQTSDPF
jgi:lipopolysaccharide transport protein LptA